MTNTWDKKKKTSNRTRSRNWTFTDHEIIDLPQIWTDNVDIIRYCGWELEEGEEKSTPHQQGWIQMKEPKSMFGMKKLFGTRKIHLEPMRGSVKQNIAYCSKAGKYQSHGTPVYMGARSDIEHVAKTISEGTTLRQVRADAPAVYSRAFRTFKELRSDFLYDASYEYRKVSVTVLKGDPRAGKTRRALYKLDGLRKDDHFLIHGSDMSWWCDYSGQKTLVIDEYANDVKITKMLQYLDGHQTKLNVKGGHTYALWTRVVITTNLSWEEWHPKANEVHRTALKARIKLWKEI